MSLVATTEAVEKATKYAKENPLVASGAAVFALLSAAAIWRKSSLRRDGKDYDTFYSSLNILNNADHTLKKDQFAGSINGYENKFSDARAKVGVNTSDAAIQKRKTEYAEMVNSFYDLVTDFYEWGWGQSFHFGPRFENETFMESIKRTEYYLALRLGMNQHTRALDVGCGVGGPMRNIAVFTGSKIDGVTINQYQVNAGNKNNKMHGLEDQCLLTRGDFQDLPSMWKPETFDCAYEIEATCHSPDRVQTFGGVAKLLKPGGLFAGYEWVMLDKYDPKNQEHVRIKEGIEVGNGLPTLVHYKHILECMEKAGFEVLDYFDANRGVHAPNEIPWYDTLNGKMSLSGFRMTHLGRMCTHAIVWFLEFIRWAPKGTTKVSALLNATAIDLVDGGKLEIFTPSFFFIGRKK